MSIEPPDDLPELLPMRRKRPSVAWCPALFLILSGRSFAISHAQADERFKPLFKEKDLTGWVKEGKADFVVRAGLVATLSAAMAAVPEPTTCRLALLGGKE